MMSSKRLVWKVMVRSINMGGVLVVIIIVMNVVESVVICVV